MMLLVKNVLFTLLVPGTVAVYLPLLIAHSLPLRFASVWFVAGVLLLLAGSAIYLWTLWDFAAIGRGTPFPLDAPRSLVVGGLYRYVRNPMYLGVLLIILGWAGVYAYPWLLVYALGVGLAVHLFILLYEEPRLKHLFGSQYEEYCRTVNRWVPCFPTGKS